MIGKVIGETCDLNLCVLCGETHKSAGHPDLPCPRSPICAERECKGCGLKYCNTHEGHECKYKCPFRLDCDEAQCPKCKEYYCSTHVKHTCKPGANCPNGPDCEISRCSKCRVSYCSVHQSHSCPGDGGSGGSGGEGGGGTGGEGGGGTGGEGGGTGGEGGGGTGGEGGGDGGEGGGDGGDDPPPEEEPEYDPIVAPDLDDWDLNFEGPEHEKTPSDSDIKTAVANSETMKQLHNQVDELLELDDVEIVLEFPLVWTGLVQKNPSVNLADYREPIDNLRSFFKVIVYIVGALLWFNIILSTLG